MTYPRLMNPPASVYVVELDPAAAHKFRDQTAVRRGAPVVYVGQSALPPGTRFAHHKRGGMHSSSVVTQYGRKILWTAGPFSDRDKAEWWESQIASDLRKQGSVVFGGH